MTAECPSLIEEAKATIKKPFALKKKKTKKKKSNGVLKGVRIDHMTARRPPPMLVSRNPGKEVKMIPLGSSNKVKESSSLRLRYIEDRYFG